MRYRSLRRGQALIEFAIIAFVTTLLLAGVLAIGMLLFSAQVLQQAADVGAQELARLPLPPDIDFEEALERPEVKAEIYDEAKLVLPASYTQAQIDSLPLINRLLFPLYVRTAERLHYPGTLAINDAGAEVVVIPIIGERRVDGVETIERWARVVEEIPTEVTKSPFNVVDYDGTSLPAGTVALRINYPYQSAALVAYQYEIDGEITGDPLAGEVDANIPVLANDGQVTNNATLPQGYQLLNGSSAAQYAGEFGLGALQAYSTTVRPYRKVVEVRGIYRREVYGE